MTQSKDIYWVASPLAIDKRASLNSKKGKILRPIARALDPSKEYHIFRKIQHWTLEIDGKCYELSPDPEKKPELCRLTTDMCQPHIVDAEQWHRIRSAHGIDPERRRVGQTKKSAREIKAEIDKIWTEFNHNWYGFFTQNCQNFAHLLFAQIAAKVADHENHHWDPLPDPVGNRLAELSQASLTGKAAIGTRAAYLAAVANLAPAAEVVEGATTATTAAEGAGTAGTAGTHAAGATHATAAGTAHGSAAGTAGAAKGAAAGGTGAGKAGIGAKFAGLSHGMTHGAGAAKFAGLGHGMLHGAGAAKAATIGGGMAKAGAVAACAHPVSGVVMTGGLLYVAVRGKRRKKLSQAQKDAGEEVDEVDPEEVEEVSIADLLEAEELILDQAENPDNALEEEIVAELNDVEQEAEQDVDEELGKLKL